MHRLDDLQAAKAALEAAEHRWENYDGSDPNRHRASVTEARVKVLEIEAELKDRDQLPRSEREELARRIDQVFPNADPRAPLLISRANSTSGGTSRAAGAS